MYRQFNVHRLYVLPTQCVYVFCMDLRTNSDYALVPVKRCIARVSHYSRTKCHNDYFVMVRGPRVEKQKYEPKLLCKFYSVYTQCTNVAAGRWLENRAVLNMFQTHALHECPN